jgi:hypothetical protein
MFSNARIGQILDDSQPYGLPMCARETTKLGRYAGSKRPDFCEFVDPLDIRVVVVGKGQPEALHRTALHSPAPQVLRVLVAGDPVEPSCRLLLTASAKLPAAFERLRESLGGQFERKMCV